MAIVLTKYIRDHKMNNLRKMKAKSYDIYKIVEKNRILQREFIVLEKSMQNNNNKTDLKKKIKNDKMLKNNRDEKNVIDTNNTDDYYKKWRFICLSENQ